MKFVDKTTTTGHSGFDFVLGEKFADGSFFRIKKSFTSHNEDRDSGYLDYDLIEDDSVTLTVYYQTTIDTRYLPISPDLVFSKDKSYTITITGSKVYSRKSNGDYDVGDFKATITE